MLRRVTVIIIMLIMAFAMVACDTVDNNLSKSPEVKLSKLQADAVAELTAYPLSKDADSDENRAFVAEWITEAKASIAATEDTRTITYDVRRVKAYVDWINAGKPVVEGLIGLGTIAGLSPERELAILKKWRGESLGQKDLDTYLIGGGSLTKIWKVLGTVKGYLAVEFVPGWHMSSLGPYKINGVSFIGYPPFLAGMSIRFLDSDNNYMTFRGDFSPTNYDDLRYYYDMLSKKDIEQVREWHELAHPEYYENNHTLEKTSYKAILINSWFCDFVPGPPVLARTKSELIDRCNDAHLDCFNDDPSAYADENEFNVRYNNEGCKKIRSYDDDFFENNVLVLYCVMIHPEEDIPVVLNSVEVIATTIYLNIDCPEHEEQYSEKKSRYTFVLEIPKTENGILDCNHLSNKINRTGTIADYPPFEELIDIDVNRAS